MAGGRKPGGTEIFAIFLKLLENLIAQCRYAPIVQLAAFSLTIAR
jgi:hypothetical protein